MPTMAALVGWVALQLFPIHVLGRAHIEMQHGIGRPLRLQLFDGQTLEEVFPAFKVAVQRAGQQGFSKPARTAQEYILCIEFLRRLPRPHIRQEHRHHAQQRQPSADVEDELNARDVRQPAEEG